jgi:polyphosphate kinase 2 (PPK2 family)
VPGAPLWSTLNEKELQEIRNQAVDLKVVRAQRGSEKKAKLPKYLDELERLQFELVKLQDWVQARGRVDVKLRCQRAASAVVEWFRA